MEKTLNKNNNHSATQTNTCYPPFQFAKRHQLFIDNIKNGIAHIVHSDKLNPQALLEIQRQLHCPLQLQQLTEEDFSLRLAKAYENNTSHAIDALTDIQQTMDLAQMVAELPANEDLLESQDDAPIIGLINAVLAQAIKQLASDIHFEIFEKSMLIRFRIDGLLHEILKPPYVLASFIISRVKIMAKLDIAEKRLPQDGRISLRIGGRAVDVRVSTIPTHFGERIVLRLLDKRNAPLDMQQLGMPKKTLQIMRKLITKPHGIILVTGPTGSGKTTTLYAALNELNDKRRNILTIEDPIEYYLPGIGQTQVNNKVNMTFARGLRAILRQDPDIIMVGEIRDLETAQMAVQASLTGHLVLSTLHTNSAIGAITRLRDMGIEPFLLASTLIAVAAQRLIRLLCPSCKKAYRATTAQCKQLNKNRQEITLYKATGCETCNNSGYSGRIGLYELITIDEKLRYMIHDEHSEVDIKKYAQSHSPGMQQDAFRHVSAGITSFAEALRITQGTAYDSF